MPAVADTALYKCQAAHAAVDLVQSGMVVGLGVGSTAIFAIQKIAERLRSGDLRDVAGIPCSLATEQAARELGIPITTLADHPRVDLTIDGADEVDPQLNLIKGGGGALLREKIVAQASAREVIVVDEAKCSAALGTNWPVPIEVIPFGLSAVTAKLTGLGCDAVLRQRSGEPYITDQNNFIVDANFGPIADPERLAAQLSGIAGIVEHGLFIGLATELIVAGADGLRFERRR